MASFYAQKQLVQTSSTGNIITLSGSGTSWSGTPFSVSGGSGASITAQSVSTTTAATITLSAGSATGALTISDGTNTTTIYVESPQWDVVVNDNFNRANTSTGSAGNTTSAGNDWSDNAGSIWSINSNQLNALCPNTYNVNTGFLNRPTGENMTDERIIVQIPYTGQASPVSFTCMLRGNGTGASYKSYLADFADTVLYLFTYSSGSGSVLGTPLTGLTTPSGHTLQIDFSVWGTSPTKYLAIFTDITSCVVLGVITGTDSTAGLQTSGEYQIGGGGPASGNANIQFSNAITMRNIGTSVLITADNSNLKYIGGGALIGSGATSRYVEQCPGGRIIAKLTGTQTCTLVYDMTNVGSYQNIDVAWKIDGQYGRTTLTSAGTVTITFPTWNGVDTDTYDQHDLEVITESSYEYTGGSAQVTTTWTTNQAMPLFEGLQLDSGASLLPVTLPVGYIEFDGDSITATTAILGDTGGTYPPQDEGAHFGWPYQAAAQIGLAPVMRGYPGNGLVNTSNSTAYTDQGVPLANACFPYSASGVNYVPVKAPSAVVVAYGNNDAGRTSTGAFQTAYEIYLATIRAAYPNAVIFCVVWSGASTYLAGITAAVAAAGANVYLLNYTALSYTTTDGAHPDVGGSVTIASQMASDIATELATLGFAYQAIQSITAIGTVGNVTVKWPPLPGTFSSYNVVKAATSAGPFAVIANVSTSTFTYLDATATGTEYYSVQGVP